MSTVDSMFELVKRHPGICFPMLGLHPCSVEENYISELNRLERRIQGSDIVGIGEIGIDLYWDQSKWKEQKDAFGIQLEWARELGLPVAIHSRNSIDHTISAVAALQDSRLTGVFHCFGEGSDEALRIIDLGFYLGIGGVISYKKSTELRTLIAQIGLDRVILETDAPYLTPVPYRGKRNESSYIGLVASVLSECLGLSFEEVCHQTSRNATALFNL